MIVKLQPPVAVTPPIASVEISLSRREAAILRAICGKIGGAGSERSVLGREMRAVVSDLYDGLEPVLPHGSHEYVELIEEIVKQMEIKTR